MTQPISGDDDGIIGRVKKTFFIHTDQGEIFRQSKNDALKL